MRGDYETSFYACVNYYGEFRKMYEREFVSNVGKLEYIFGMTVFNKDKFSVQSEKEIKKIFKNLPLIVQLHGVAPDKVNLGIYFDNIDDLPDFVSVCFLARNKNGCFAKIPK